MPSWQATAAPQPHVRTGTCWCGYVAGRIGTTKPTAGLYGRGVTPTTTTR